MNTTLAIMVLVLSGFVGFGGMINMLTRGTDKWYGLASLALCMAGLVAARWML